eukprot:CAMPEP_0119009512 /NCGR_PEP_ID=MMETSP1176-20130426/4413_1 /TAXON_ID=265551 /ORGANISM="Synedropsis recta cf, Strain CCMP1620" /LENGTH=66 /DNA_ID=CAMNT_0006962039 /DNA_START=161 /DNA_END=361 /DNA_ORIENTATION=-
MSASNRRRPHDEILNNTNNDHARDDERPTSQQRHLGVASTCTRYPVPETPNTNSGIAYSSTNNGLV